jgi:DNA-binding MarR family transcriptional regulator
MELERAERRFKLATRDYAQLAAFRHALRRFLRFSEDAAARTGLTAQHYQAMLVVRGWPEDERVTIADLARHLLIKHNSAVELVDRLVKEDLVARESAADDRRKVHLALTGRGRRLLAQLAAVHRAELKRIGPDFTRFFAELSRPPGAAARPPRPARSPR